ncbi:hypothetical protein IFO70_09845 [Phormidium tenue FACHB-886]|nr:hypothetical protein [Phormidium tenue FACHB-886]
MVGMQKFIYKLSGFAAMQAVLLGGFMLPYFVNHKLTVEDGFMAGTLDKHALLQQQPSPRLIFVGGSAFAFGNNSEYIAQQVGAQYHPINMGLHAGLGMQYMLNEIQNGLKPGDVVVLSFEYENFVDFPPGPKDVSDVLEARWQNVQYVPLNYLPALLDKGLVNGGGILRRSLQSLTGEINREPFYQRSTFNKYGDVVGHYELPSLTEEVASDGKTFEFQPQAIQQAVQYMNDFYAVAKAKDVKVVYVYPPLVDRLLLKSQPEIQKIESALSNELKFPVLDRPADVAYPDSYYFDTRYHLNKIGVDARSKHLVEKLSQYLKAE